MSKQSEERKLQSAEWYAMRFEELRAWAEQQEKKSDDSERKFEELGHTIAAARCQGRASMAFRMQRWIDHFVGRAK
jgi:hypothetical protein